MTTESKELLKLDRMPLKHRPLPHPVLLFKWSSLNFYEIDAENSIFKLTDIAKQKLRNEGFSI